MHFWQIEKKTAKYFLPPLIAICLALHEDNSIKLLRLILLEVYNSH